MGGAAPSSRCGGAFSSPYYAWSSSRSSGSSAADLENRPLNPRRLAVPDIGSTALRCRSTDHHPQGNGEIRMSGSGAR
jgi:hypothetical protein